jgi:thymidine phosphorylase
LVSRRAAGPCSTINRSKLAGVLEGYDKLEEPIEKAAALIAAWYLDALDDVEIIRRTENLLDSGRVLPSLERNLRDLLQRLGEPRPKAPGRRGRKRGRRRTT